MTKKQMEITKLALSLRYYQHTIAAYFGFNQGRVSEFKNGSDFRSVKPAKSLPRDFPLPR